MLFKEWSLIVNSLLLQLATGMFTSLAVYRLILSGELGSENVIALTSPGIALTGPVVLTGMIASIFHLGSPIRAYRSIVNIGTSWLSREILFTSTFFVLWFVGYLMEINGKSNSLLIWITVMAGLLAVASMAYIYYSTGKPGWFSFNTFAGFFGSAVIFGSVSSIIIVFNGISSSAQIKPILITSGLISMLTLIIRLIGQLNLIPTLSRNKNEFTMDRLVSAAPLTSKQARMFKLLSLWGLACSITGVGLILPVLFAGSVNQGGAVIIAGAILTGFGELLGRSGFYSLVPNE